MKAALIPPISALRSFGKGDFHLLLSHLLENKAYWDHYEEQRNRGAYLVLDNSAHENGQGNDPEFLMYQACKIGAQEVVVPDVLFDVNGTIEGALAAHETWFEKRLSPTEIVRTKALMYVPQGNTYIEWQHCLLNLVNIHLFTARKYDLSSSLIIGVSKDYETWEGGLLRLVSDDLVPLRESLFRQGVRMQVHMLGWGRQLWDLDEIARTHPWIRSTDSAKPFVYAFSGRNLWFFRDTSPPLYPGRSEDYFERKMTTQVTATAHQNVELFRSLAEGRQVLHGRRS